MSDSYAIQTENLYVQLGSKKILHNLTVETPPGAIGLLGPNGAGKSTLLKTMMGFIKPKKGKIKVFGIDPSKNGAEVRQILGYMPEDDTYLPGMSAVEFVTYCGLLCGLPVNDARQRAHLVLNYCGLGEARYRKIDTYSTGMRQRVKLAQAIVHDPRLLFLDEPTNGLDPKGRAEMLDLIKDVSSRKGISVILSSHLLPDVETVCEHVMVLFNGRLAKAGEIRMLKKIAIAAYEVRFMGEFLPFQTAIQQVGGSCEAGQRDGLLKVTLPEETDVRVVFEASKKAGGEIRHLAREELSLQDVFSSAIEESRHIQEFVGIEK